MPAPGNEGALGAPWLIDRDNDERIVVVDSRGEIVWLEDWSNIPNHIDPKHRENIVSEVRARIRATCTAVNCHADMLAALESALLALCSIEPTTENLAARARIRRALSKAGATS